MLTDEIEVTNRAVPAKALRQLMKTFPVQRFEELHQTGFKFYRTTFWYPLSRSPASPFEEVIERLRVVAGPGADVTGVEWWFSVLQTNTTPGWLLSQHFDRSNLRERDRTKDRHPSKASVLFLNTVPYSELVVTDQLSTERGRRPKKPEEMTFIRPRKNRYVVFPGELYHGVIGRMWRPAKPNRLRLTMAVNWWTVAPEADYLRDSSEALAAFGLDPQPSAADPVV